MQPRFLLTVGAVSLVFLGTASMTDKDHHLRQLRLLAERIVPVHAAKRKSQPGDWLASHDEPGQSFDDYTASHPNRPTAQRTTLYIQPLGDFSAPQQELIQETAELLSRFWDIPTKCLNRLLSM